MLSVIEAYDLFCNDRTNSEVTFVNVLSSLKKYSDEHKISQTQLLEEFKRKIPIIFIACKSDIKGCDLKWGEKKCTYQMVVVLGNNKTINHKYFMQKECLKYRFDINDVNAVNLNNERLDDAGWAIAKDDITYENFNANKPKVNMVFDYNN